MQNAKICHYTVPYNHPPPPLPLHGMHCITLQLPLSIRGGVC